MDDHSSSITMRFLAMITASFSSFPPLGFRDPVTASLLGRQRTRVTQAGASDSVRITLAQFPVSENNEKEYRIEAVVPTPEPLTMPLTRVG